jgi:putative addiction module CopG family antidote
MSAPPEQMSISMSPKMAKFIRGKVQRGGYTNASKVVRTAPG